MVPTISRIRIYPIKSLDPVELTQAEIGVHSLLHDREFAMLAQDGRFVNGKRTGRVNELKASYDLEKYLVTLMLRTGSEARTFHLLDDTKDIETYLTDFFKLPITFLRNAQGELMDIPNASSVTILSDASLKSLQRALPAHDLDDLRLRFRLSLEISGVDLFWEDQLFGEPGTGVEFLVGEVKMIGISPRARCNVPPRDPHTGITDKTFIKAMMNNRASSLSSASKLLQYGGYYQLSVDTHIPESEKGKILKVGDEIKIIGIVHLQE